jgi:hypothetical protein
VLDPADLDAADAHPQIVACDIRSGIELLAARHTALLRYSICDTISELSGDEVDHDH